MKRLERVYCRAFQGVFRAALPFMPYREPKILHSIVQIPDVLQERNISKVLLVTDESIRGLGLTKHLEEELQRRSIFCAVYDKVVANPTIQNIEQARAVYLKSGAQAIIAFGGGSVMDCAKVTGARIVKPRKPVYKMKGLLRICKPLPLLIAVPTTAGTGSETTLAAGTAAFTTASFMSAESPTMLMNAMFALAGIAWATINVNSFPMVVEMCSGGNVGKYTGFYYTASMAAQVATPMLSGLLMDRMGMHVLFPYAAVFTALAFVTMLFVRHGDSKPEAKRGLEALDEMED